jgi:acetyltransferase-like isoleucine patch superfamily enzyme
MLVLKLVKPIAAMVSYIHYKRDRLRLAKLIHKGLKIGKNVYIMDDVEFDGEYPFLIEIGDNCRIGRGVRILTHDATTFRDLGVTRLAPVRILEGTFIGERAIILPGVKIGPRALIGAGSMVNRDIGEDKAAAGNPARPYGTFSDLLAKYRQNAKSGTIFKEEDFEKGVVTAEKMILALRDLREVFICGVPSKDPYYINTDMNEIRANARQKYNELASSLTPSEPAAIEPERETN